MLEDGDTLPPNLRELSVVDATSASPLLPLTQLQDLTFCCDLDQEGSRNIRGSLCFIGIGLCSGPV